MWRRIEAAVTGRGFVLLGGFHPAPEDRVPPLPGGASAGTVYLVGNAGPALWRAFADSPEGGDGRRDPMNRWTARVMTDIAEGFGAAALFPFGGPPHHPFVAWAKRGAPVRESPLGMLIHPEYGLWHAYRAALVLPGRLDLPPRDPRPHPCAACADKPCLTACPVGAFAADAPDGPAGYDVDACVGHLATAAGADCVALGCRARRACPVGRGYVYDRPHAEFHMRAFLGALGKEGSGA